MHEMQAAADQHQQADIERCDDGGGQQVDDREAADHKQSEAETDKPVRRHAQLGGAAPGCLTLCQNGHAGLARGHNLFSI